MPIKLIDLRNATKVLLFPLSLILTFHCLLSCCLPAPLEPHFTDCVSRDLETFQCWWSPGSFQNLSSTGDLRVFYLKKEWVFFNQKRTSNCFACVFVYVSSTKNVFITSFAFVFSFFSSTAQLKVNGKSVQSISIQKESASSMQTTHLFGSPTACSSAAKTSPISVRMTVSLWKILVSNKHLYVYPDIYNISNESRGFYIPSVSGILKHVLAFL